MSLRLKLRRFQAENAQHEGKLPSMAQVVVDYPPHDTLSLLTSLTQLLSAPLVIRVKRAKLSGRARYLDKWRLNLRERGLLRCVNCSSYWSSRPDSPNGSDRKMMVGLLSRGLKACIQHADPRCAKLSGQKYAVGQVSCAKLSLVSSRYLALPDSFALFTS